jgi:hypothetical protein
VSGYDVAGDLAEQLDYIFNDNFAYSMPQYNQIVIKLFL